MKVKRQAKILEIIMRQPVDTQEELQNLLKNEGYHVTQATVSRDIKEIDVYKRQPMSSSKNGCRRKDFSTRREKKRCRRFRRASA